MQSARKTETRPKKSTKDDLVRPEREENPKKSVYSVTTPRNFIQKSSTADIYARKKPKQPSKATPRINESPMKDLLKSSPNTSLNSRSSKTRMETKSVKSAVTLNSSVKSTPRRLTSNVTVNSPIARRRLNLDETESSRGVSSGVDRKETPSSAKPTKDQPRQRTKTRTLEDDEVKILTPDAIDNNAALQHLSRQLAKPKAFYVELEAPRTSQETNTKVPAVSKQKDPSSEEDVSYEDDFESYESDFESYHSEANSDSTNSNETSVDDDKNDVGNSVDDKNTLGNSVDDKNTLWNSVDDKNKEHDGDAEKEAKDEERMLDSGNYELRDSQRSASRKPGMDFILEGSEGLEDKKTSLTDEGFQEMSSSSAVSSMRIVHVEVLDRPLFIDFTKSKQNKRKRKIFERLQQRAKDILSMVTLHEMSYSLFEMKPIPYDLYMATFGRKNYTQTAVQTFEDGVSEDIQTDDILSEHKWTQVPVEFSKSFVVINEKIVKKDVRDKEDFVSKFNLLINKDVNKADNESEEYKMNPLKIFLEQKDGAGGDCSLPEEVFKSKLKALDFNVNKLRKFLKKSEGRISRILSLNAGSNEILNLGRSSKFTFSKGFISISTKSLTDEKLSFLKSTKITDVAISATKDNLIMTYHKKSSVDAVVKCIICLWDTNVANCQPLKVLKATDNVIVGRYRGNTNGIFVAALEDGTLHLWDLSEEPTWCSDVASASDENHTKLVEKDTSQMSQIESDREWNLRNSNVTYEEKPECTMQVSAYTSSAVNMQIKEPMDAIVGLEFIGDARIIHDGLKVVGQICTLQRLGILTTWSIIQDKSTTRDIGKAYWSKLKLEKNQTVNLSDHIDIPISDSNKSDLGNNFNLNAAKRRLSIRKHDRIERRKEISRPKSAILKNIDRPSSVASPRKNVPIRNVNYWDFGVVCNHLKVLRLNDADNYLVATSNGEVVCCKKNISDFKVDRLFIASDKSDITRLEVINKNLPYFLAASDSGTINLCSILDARVLLTLDCRNGPPITTERCLTDSKGRFIASVPVQSSNDADSSRFSSKFSIRHLAWLGFNPFCIIAVLANGTAVTWELTHSDINAKSALDNVRCVSSSRCSSLALITSDGEVQLHRIASEDATTIELFKKYVALL